MFLEKEKRRQENQNLHPQGIWQQLAQTFEIMGERKKKKDSSSLFFGYTSLDLQGNSYPQCRISAMNSTLLSKEPPTENNTAFVMTKSNHLFCCWLNMAAVDNCLMEQAHKKKKDPCFSRFLLPYNRQEKLYCLHYKFQFWRYNHFLGRKWDHRSVFLLAYWQIIASW